MSPIFENRIAHVTSKARQVLACGAVWPLGNVYLAIDPCVGLGPRMISIFTMESLILAQNERWRRGLGMQVERERGGNSSSRVANG